MKHCEICNLDFDNTKIYANHIRWKHTDKHFSDEAYTKLKQLKKNRITEKVKCSICGKELEVIYIEGHKKDKYFCSYCCHSRVHSEESKLKLSELMKQKSPFIKRKCKCGSKISYSNKSGLCLKCLRLKKRESVAPFKQYRQDCLFQFSLNDYPEEFDFSLIEKYGWYAAKNHGNNLAGVSRDHRYSVKEGFINRVDPKVISHPANCQLLKHSDNARKHSKISLTLEELLERIKKWDCKYNN